MTRQMYMGQMCIGIVCCILFCAGTLFGQETFYGSIVSHEAGPIEGGGTSGLLDERSYFAGAVGGISTLSADGKSEISEALSRVSLYDPKNGPTVMFFGGWHFHDFVSLQASYAWSRNRLTMTSTVHERDDFAFYEQMRRASQQSIVGDLLVYFRRRNSIVRPYLAAGVGVVRLSSDASSIRETRGTLPAPQTFHSTKPTLRVAVGIDVALGGGWAFRYSFSETMRKNTFSEQLTPRGERGLKHFENLFGFVKSF